MRQQPKRLLDQVRDALRVKHYSIRTEEAYVSWIKRYILFHDKRHPRDTGGCEIETFLTYLAVDKNVAASTQNQALSALLFLYHQVLKKDLEHPIDSVRARRPKRLPTVLTKEAVGARLVLAQERFFPHAILGRACGDTLRGDKWALKCHFHGLDPC